MYMQPASCPQQGFEPGGGGGTNYMAPSKVLEEPQQLYIHNFCIFKSWLPQFFELQALRYPDLNPCSCRMWHCIATCRLNAPFWPVPPPGSTAVNLLLQAHSPAVLLPATANCLTFSRPPAQKWLHYSVPPKRLLSCKALHNPTGNHAQHLANTCWSDWMQQKRRQKHIS